MADSPAISVIIATHGRAPLLRRALEALARQELGLERFEVVVALDGPDPASAEVLREAEGGSLPLRWIQGEGRRGPAVARNAALRLATAPLVAITDDDCEPSPGWLSAIAGTFAASPETGIVVGKTTTDRTRLTPFSHFVENLDRISHQTCNIGYRRELLDRVGGFDERFPFSNEDTDLFLRVEALARVAFIPEAHVLHPPREVSVRQYARGARRFEGDFIFYNKHPERYRARHGGRGPLAAVVWEVGVKHVAKLALSEARWLGRSPHTYFRFLAALVLFEWTLWTGLPGFWWRHRGRLDTTHANPVCN